MKTILFAALTGALLLLCSFGIQDDEKAALAKEVKALRAVADAKDNALRKMVHVQHVTGQMINQVLESHLELDSLLVAGNLSESRKLRRCLAACEDAFNVAKIACETIFSGLVNIQIFGQAEMGMVDNYDQCMTNAYNNWAGCDHDCYENN